MTPSLACILLVHTEPAQVRRLVRALDPLPVFLHCDARTEAKIYEEMTEDLPERCVLLPRLPTPWARWPAVAVELSGYRAALRTTDASHIAVMSGSDYPLVSVRRIGATLQAFPKSSILKLHRFPFADWGRSGGLARLRYPHAAIGRQIVRFPIPRPLPKGICFAGASAPKILARHHAEQVLAASDARPDLIRFWRSSWCADETFVASMLNTQTIVPDFPDHHVPEIAWFINWDRSRQKSPPWLGVADFPRLCAAARGDDGRFPRLFARKFSEQRDARVLDLVDEFRAEH